MATNVEEINARLGLDISTIQRNTQIMLDGQKKASMDYVAFWESAMAKRQQAELAMIEKVKLANIAAAEQQAIAYRVAADAQSGGTKSFFLKQQIQQDIAAGSVPLSWQKGTKEFEEAEQAKKAAKALGEVEKESHGLGRVLRESAVLMREGLRGNFTRMIGSATILAQYLGSLLLVAGTIGAALGTGVSYLVNKVAPGYGGNPSDWWSWYGARKDAKQSQADLKGMESRESSHLEQRIEEMKKAGLISGYQADNFKDQLKRGDVSGVLGATNKLMPQLQQHQAAEAAAKAATSEQARLFQDYEHQRAGLKSPQERLRYDTEIRAGLFAAHARGADVAKEIEKSWQNILQDNKDIAKEADDRRKTEQKINEEKDKAARESQAAVDKYNRQSLEEDMPTLGDLAGRRYMSRLDRWKRFNLGTGNGPFSGIAQDVERSKAMIQWNIEHGNANFDDQGNLIGGNAFDWLQRKNRDVQMLRSAGLRDDKFEEMNAHLSDIHARLNQNLTVLINGVNGDGKT